MRLAALHDLDPEFRSFSRSEKVAAVLQSLNIRQPLPVQSMYIFKVRTWLRTTTQPDAGQGMPVLSKAMPEHLNLGA